ncbi:MAG: hypothetical protein KZQ94_04070 [Candidatus Thiodiazotropha sp. (ex Troendleina suluensis)]|nr:hypothetical protein [Candidatus Thiodiazotropha sp. (ex Troendleina suluensis)]
MNKTITALIVILVLSALLFPIYRPQGWSLDRSIDFIGNEGEKELIRISADVFRGVWLSPDGGVTRRKYYETFLLAGEGKIVTVNGVLVKHIRSV